MTASAALIVDDDASLAENLAEIIGSLGVEIDLVNTGRAALERTASRPYDVALVDVRLPDEDGTHLASALREVSPGTEVVLITGDATVESAIAAVQSGAFAYVLKPFAAQHLIETVRRALGQARLWRERERLRGELERSERRNRELVEAIPAYVMALDEADRITLWNRRLEETTGHARGEMIGQPGRDLVKGDGVRRLPVKAGGERLVRWDRATLRLPDSGTAWTYAVGADVTAEQEMLRRTLRAERLAAVGTLAAGLAHEVRNPLNSATLQLDVLTRRLDRGDVQPESLKQVAGLVREEIKRLERLVNDFLSFVQPRPLDLETTELSELCRSILHFVQPEADAAQITLATELTGELPPLAGDPERLRQVLLNLVRNGIEAMPDGGTLTIRTRPTTGAVEIDVEDTGHGFTDEAPIFDAFFTTKPQGTGLGLTIVHRIVADHGGTVRVRSQPGQTCFTIALPTARGV